MTWQAGLSPTLPKDRILYPAVPRAGVHWVMMGSYVPYGEDSAQAAWLRADLAAVDRARTPWVIAVMHSPWCGPAPVSG